MHNFIKMNKEFWMIMQLRKWKQKDNVLLISKIYHGI